MKHSEEKNFRVEYILWVTRREAGLESFQIHISEKQCSQLLARTKRCLPGAMSGPPVCNPFQLTRSPFTIHSASIHASTQYCLARASAGGGQRRTRAFSFPLRPRPGPREESQKSSGAQHRRASTPRRAESCTHPSSCTGMPRPASSHKGSLPEAHLQAILNWACTLMQNVWGAQGVSGIPAPGAEMHSYPRRNAPPPAFVLPPGMHPPRTLAGTYRPRKLGGPRPEVDHLPRSIHGARVRTTSQQDQPNAWAARVCPRRRLSAFFQR